mmetsp:Transcript_3659/g.8276  ORF Transcript_3659/g.8276 Transcript_3659/m.8276 type:complete len:251 (+) Transcript_3659:420-1172(+)
MYPTLLLFHRSQDHSSLRTSLQLRQSQMPRGGSYQIVRRERRPHRPDPDRLRSRQRPVFQSQHVGGHGKEEDGVHVAQELEILLSEQGSFSSTHQSMQQQEQSQPRYCPIHPIQHYRVGRKVSTNQRNTRRQAQKHPSESHPNLAKVPNRPPQRHGPLRAPLLRLEHGRHEALRHLTQRVHERGQTAEYREHDLVRRHVVRSQRRRRHVGHGDVAGDATDGGGRDGDDEGEEFAGLGFVEVAVGEGEVLA